MGAMKQDINRINFLSHFLTIFVIVVLNSVFNLISVLSIMLAVITIIFSLFLTIQLGKHKKDRIGKLLTYFIAAFNPVVLTLFLSFIQYRSEILFFLFFLIMLRNPYLGFGPSVLNGLVSMLCYIILSIKIYHFRTEEIVFGAIMFLMASVLSWALTHRLWMFEQQSMRDGLTGLRNYRSLDLSLKQEIKRSLRTGRPLSLLMIDIDNFKKYNDTMGHIKGDRTLREVANIMSANIRDGDMIFRYGGEEFCVLLPEVGLAKTESIAERIRSQVEESFSGHGFPVTVSIGISSSEKGTRRPKELLEEADKALYRAKILKNRVVHF